MPDDLFLGLRRYLSLKEGQGHACRMVGSGDAEEVTTHEAPSFLPGVAYVEGEPLQARDTAFEAARDSGTSGFRFFLDGVQYSHLVGFVDNVPLVHHLSAAVILERMPDTRGFRLWQWSRPHECVLIPFVHLDPSELCGLGVPAEDTTDISRDVPLEVTALRALAHSKSQRLRRRTEVEMVRRWLNAGLPGWLMVDGTLSLLPDLPQEGAMAGVVKSFGAQYFDGSEQLRIISLRSGWRSTAFQLPRGSLPVGGAGAEETRRWYSWYVRIRDHQDRDADFGLLRVEVPPGPAILARADEISRWLVAERAPLSTPDPRWDSLLYPIRACERFLRSSLPQRNRVHLRVRSR